jgi:AraC family ethanolamine operon transcriptional activator
VRLHRARQALRSGSLLPGRIRDVAVDCGFWHLGLFAKNYKEMFGESPSQTPALRI